MFKKKINKGIIGRPFIFVVTWIFAGLPLKETLFSDLKQKVINIFRVRFGVAFKLNTL